MSSVAHIDQLPRDAAAHFRLHVYGAILALRVRLPVPDDSNGLLFLTGYYDELAAAGFDAPAPDDLARWWELVDGWESSAQGHLPLRALRESLGLDHVAMGLLITVGLVDEDARFAELFEALHGLSSEPRPTLGLLSTWSDDDAARGAVYALLEAGLVETPDASAARSRWTLQVPTLMWDAVRGRPIPAAAQWARHRPPQELLGLDELMIDGELRATLERVVQLLAAGDQRPIVVRGPAASGRRTIVGAIAKALGFGVLEIDDAQAGTRLVGPLATALRAAPLYRLEPAPGEAVALPQPAGYWGPLAAVVGRRGGVRTEQAVTLTIETASPEVRTAQWATVIEDVALANELGASMRVSSGTIRRLGKTARAEAALAGRPLPSAADVRAAKRALEAGTLETLATRVAAEGGWDLLATAPDTAIELQLLESRCRERERLRELGGPALRGQLTPGVRALFSGPSGTGKSLAARLLASRLGKELFAVDLATVVNKYLGETEKNLDALFTRAEDLDVILLLDEGDALMARRTDVNTSNDRYANLETNFLLTRLESYEGILVVTTNAGERIDPAFRRRLDVVVDFPAPGPGERLTIWQLHLPSGHTVSDSFLNDVAARCELSGGQIRNAVLHAALLALNAADTVGTNELEAAVRREYRKTGAVCPLRPGALAYA